MEIFNDITREIELEKRVKEKYILQEHLPDYLREAAMKRGGGENKTKAAEILQIDRTTLWRKMKKYGIRQRL